MASAALLGVPSRIMRCTAPRPAILDLALAAFALADGTRSGEVRVPPQLARRAPAETTATQPLRQTLSLFLILQVEPLIEARALVAAG